LLKLLLNLASNYQKIEKDGSIATILCGYVNKLPFEGLTPALNFNRLNTNKKKRAIRVCLLTTTSRAQGNSLLPGQRDGKRKKTRIHCSLD
jgi:hypothetical protein